MTNCTKSSNQEQKQAGTQSIQTYTKPKMNNKAYLIHIGILNDEQVTSYNGAAYRLAELLEMLTSTSRETRERAKAEVRRLTKAGQAEGAAQVRHRKNID